MGGKSLTKETLLIVGSIYIYALKDPDTGDIRYVGKTNNIRARLRNHKSDAKNTHKVNWIQSLLRQNKEPVMEVLDIVTDGFWEQWEVAWIEFFRESGYALTNHTLGGRGGMGTNKSPETKRKISASMTGKKNALGKHWSLSQETRNKMSESVRKRKRRFVILHWK